MVESDHDITQLLQDWSRGERDALDRLAPLVFEELRRLARYHMARERQGHTLEPTALVSELFVRLLGRRRVQWENRAQFFKYATVLMRCILVDHARRCRSARRGGDVNTVPLHEASIPVCTVDVDLIAVHEALRVLAREDSRAGYLVELKFFLGLTHDEIARLWGVSRDTVKLKWTAAKIRLYREIQRGRSGITPRRGENGSGG